MSMGFCVAFFIAAIVLLAMQNYQGAAGAATAILLFFLVGMFCPNGFCGEYSSQRDRGATNIQGYLADCPFGIGARCSEDRTPLLPPGSISHI
jgi:hypothetical protein